MTPEEHRTWAYIKYNSLVDQWIYLLENDVITADEFNQLMRSRYPKTWSRVIAQHVKEEREMSKSSIKFLISASIMSFLTACTPYTIVSGVSSLTTGKGLSEHALSKVTGGDCSAFDFIVHNDTHSYYCEMPRNESNSYVRDPF